MKLLFKKLTPLAVAVAAFLIQSPAAQADVLASETWNQDTTGASISGAGGGTGFSGSWSVGDPSNGYLEVTRGPASTGAQGGPFTPLSYANYTSSGGNYLNLASGFGGSQYNYASRALSTSTFAAAGLSTGGVIGADNTSLWGSMIYSNDTSGNASNATASLVFNGGAAGQTFTLNLNQPSPPAGGNSNFVLFEINYGSSLTNDTITVWTDPNLSTYASLLASPSATYSGNLAFTNFNVATTYNGGGGSQLGIDDITFGQTESDVTGVSAPSQSVPEPSTYSMLALGIGATWLMYFRRRKSQV